MNEKSALFDVHCPKCNSGDLTRLHAATGPTAVPFSGYADGQPVQGTVIAPGTGIDKPRQPFLLSVLALLIVGASFFAMVWFNSGWAGLGAFVLLCLIFNKPISAWSKTAESREADWKRWCDNGFVCKRCEHVFIPGSDEVFSLD